MSGKRNSGVLFITFLFLIMFGVSIYRVAKIFINGQFDNTFSRDKLNMEEINKLENQIKSDPDNLSLRIKILKCYFDREMVSKSARKARERHIMWLIKNHPESKIAGSPYAELDPILDGNVYYTAKDLWLNQVKNHGNNVMIIGNAANFFFINDEDISENLLKKAQILEPSNPKWYEELGELYMIEFRDYSGSARKNMALKSLRQLEKAFSFTTEERKKFYMLSDLAKVAFEAGELKKAKTYATLLLNKAYKYKNDWNYGNAIFYGNMVLGRLSLKLGDVKKAEYYLLKSGKTPGSPQLDTFGPNMSLAKDLLERGDRKVVIKFFSLCTKFWEIGRDKLKKWISCAKDGEIPDFGKNLNY